MKAKFRVCVGIALLCVTSQAQVVFIDNNSPTTGTINTFPWGQANGFTTLHVYTAAQLSAGGVCVGAVLSDVAVAPASGTTGTYNAPQARFSIGHLATPIPIAGLWEANLTAPSVVHDLSSGPYTFPWTSGVWTSLPGVASATFVWDGTTDIGIFYTSSPGTTGTFSARRTATNLRHAVTVFNATNQAPTSNGLFAMKVQLTFLGGSPTYQVNQPAASFDIDGTMGLACLPALVTRAANTPFTINFQSTLTGLGWEFGYTVFAPLVPAGGGAIVLPLTTQILNLNIAAPTLQFLNGFGFPPFPGNFSIPGSSPGALQLSGQMFVLNPTNPDGVSLSGATTLNVQ